MFRRMKGSWRTTVMGAVVALSAAACGSGSYGGNEGPEGPGGQSAMGGEPPACQTDADCVDQTCDVGSGTCTGEGAPGQQQSRPSCGTRTCNDEAWRVCTHKGACSSGSTRPCTPSYPYGCTAQQACDASCGWGACTDACSPFAPLAGMPGVTPDSAVFVPRQSGPSCAGSSNGYGPWQVCPDGSQIYTIGCVMVSSPAGGSCEVPDRWKDGATLTVIANGNCRSIASAQLEVTCIAD
jgi:hypothetical protein